MSNQVIAALTKLDSSYPGYINLSRKDDGTVVITVRGDPTLREGVFVCGYARDRGQPGRCTPGDENCNNYCNTAPHKGPMAGSPKPCGHTIEGGSAVLRLSADDWKALLSEIVEGVNF